MKNITCPLSQSTVARWNLKPPQKNKKSKQLPPQTVQIFRGNKQPRSVHYDISSFLELDDATHFNDNESDDGSLGSSFYEDLWLLNDEHVGGKAPHAIHNCCQGHVCHPKLKPGPRMPSTYLCRTFPRPSTPSKNCVRAENAVPNCFQTVTKTTYATQKLVSRAVLTPWTFSRGAYASHNSWQEHSCHPQLWAEARMPPKTFSRGTYVIQHFTRGTYATQKRSPKAISKSKPDPLDVFTKPHIQRVTTWCPDPLGSTLL